MPSGITEARIMETFFNIRYEFDREKVRERIDATIAEGGKGYVCVSDGVILSLVQQDDQYRKVIDGSLFSICDSGWVPMYVRWIHGLSRRQYCGSQIFEDTIRAKRYRMMFLGTSERILKPLQENLSKIDPRIAEMPFVELPFCPVEAFDYQAIGEMVDDYAPDIVWVALGAPKQERFMNRLLPHIDRGVLIAVGAAFNFFSGQEIKRAPRWMVRCKMEFVHRIFCEPKKQLRRCRNILITLPPMLYREVKAKRRACKQPRT